MRRARPAVVITQAPTDYHRDHRTTGETCWDICVKTTVPNIKTEYPVCETIPEIFYMDTIAGISFQPEQYAFPGAAMWGAICGVFPVIPYVPPVV